MNILRSIGIMCCFTGGALALQALPTLQELAKQALAHPKLEFLARHVSPGHDRDQATALDNVRDTSNGQRARRSAYGNAPGGTTPLNAQMLYGLLRIADRHAMRVTALAGSSHSANSRHYIGVAFDVDRVDGVPVSPANTKWKEVVRLCSVYGATEILKPGDPGHTNHVHCAWPRPR